MTRDAFYKAESLNKELEAITKMKNIISNSTLSGDEYYAAHDSHVITVNKLTEARDLIVKEYEWCYDGYSPVSKKLETIIRKIDKLLATETTEDIKDWVPNPVFEEKNK